LEIVMKKYLLPLMLSAGVALSPVVFAADAAPSTSTTQSTASAASTSGKSTTKGHKTHHKAKSTPGAKKTSVKKHRAHKVTAKKL
jgi:hypothetical protein